MMPTTLRDPSPIDEAVHALRGAAPVLIVDGEQDPKDGAPLQFLALSADRITPEQLNHLARLSGGLLYICLTPERVAELGLRRSSLRNERSWQGRLLQSFDAVGCQNSGVTMSDRARTIAMAVDPGSGPADVRQPGHMLALESTAGGTLKRMGYTEAAIDLALMAGSPAAVISEVLGPNGEIADQALLEALAERHRIPIVSVVDIARSRARQESVVRIAVETLLPTSHGTFRAVALSSPLDDDPYLALVAGDLDARPPLVSVHLRCMSAALRSQRCDCLDRVDRAMRQIAEEGGILLHLPRSVSHDVVADESRTPPRALPEDEICALALRALGVTRMRVVSPGPLERGQPIPGVEVIESVTLKEAS
jgi:3,4-dihydroxy 2-butanone 4-phosphate synthase/GTP cyclohydrolase II